MGKKYPIADEKGKILIYNSKIKTTAEYSVTENLKNLCENMAWYLHEVSQYLCLPLTERAAANNQFRVLRQCVSFIFNQLDCLTIQPNSIFCCKEEKCSEDSSLSISIKKGMYDMTDKKRYVGIIFRESPMKAYQLTVEAISRKTLLSAGEIEQILSEMAQEMHISPISMLKTVRFLGVIDGLCLNIISRYHMQQTTKVAQSALSSSLLGHWEETHSLDSAQVVEAGQTVVLQRHRERPESPLPAPVAGKAKPEERLAPALSCGARFAATLKKNRAGAEKKGKKAAFRRLPRISPVAAPVTQEEQLDAALSCGAWFAALLQKKPQGAEKKGVDKKARQLRGLYSGKTLGLRHACMKTYPLRQEVGSVSKEFCRVTKEFCLAEKESGQAGKKFWSAKLLCKSATKEFCLAEKEFCRARKQSG